jgi:superfamily II DNA/RNA helicase
MLAPTQILVEQHFKSARQQGGFMPHIPAASLAPDAGSPTVQLSHGDRPADFTRLSQLPNLLICTPESLLNMLREKTISLADLDLLVRGCRRQGREWCFA